jgi:vancomycin resistance protein YoaR
MAQVYIRGELVDGIGGGVCQVSSTLFNAVLLAGLKIVERNAHPETVPYVPPGRDATVAYGFKDFRFSNSNSQPIGIVTTVGGSHLTVHVYGSAEDKKQVKVYSGSLRRVAAGSKTVVDGKLAPGARRVVEKGVGGASVVLYRKMAGPDGRDIVNAFRSRYAPHKAVVAVGASPAATPQ